MDQSKVIIKLSVVYAHKMSEIFFVAQFYPNMLTIVVETYTFTVQSTILTDILCASFLH